MNIWEWVLVIGVGILVAVIVNVIYYYKKDDWNIVWVDHAEHINDIDFGHGKISKCRYEIWFSASIPEFKLEIHGLFAKDIPKYKEAVEKLQEFRNFLITGRLINNSKHIKNA